MTQAATPPINPALLTKPPERAGDGVFSGDRSEGAKRLFDVAAVVAASPVWLPVLAVLVVLVRLDSRGPAVYRQRRYGRGGRAFTLVKLRTMVADADEALPGHLAGCAEDAAEWARHGKLRRDPRLTRIGGWLRRSSLDELPQLWNVLRGEMSLVGPRPIPLAERARYGPRFTHYRRVRPGLTGLWQVSGRNELPYGRRVTLDRRYVRRRSWRGDAAILVRTVAAVLSRRGAY
ncbi:MAG: sugar transferase [Planctomycetota bacterium]